MNEETTIKIQYLTKGVGRGKLNSDTWDWYLTVPMVEDGHENLSCEILLMCDHHHTGESEDDWAMQKTTYKVTAQHLIEFFEQHGKKTERELTPENP